MRVIRVTARAGATPSSPLRRMSESKLTCLAFSAMLIRAGEPNASVASPSALIPRSSGPRRNSACRRVAWSRSTVTGPMTRHGVGASSPGAVPVNVAAPANRRPPIPAAGSPWSAPSNSAAGQLGPASTERRSGVPSGPGFSEASLKTTGALSGPENCPLRCAGPSSDGAAASISTPEISAPAAAPTIFTRPSCTLRRSNPVEWSPAMRSGGSLSAPSRPRVRVRTGFSRRMSENRSCPLGSLTSSSSSRADANESFAPSRPGALTKPSPNAR